MSIAEEFQAVLGAAGYTDYRQMEQIGLRLAVVTNISDEQKLNRVKCMPIENEKVEETDWCYVMSPFGGNQYGQFFFPNVNDLVVLGYLGGDPHRPVVLGALWNTQVKPPYVIQNGKVYHYSIKTPSGTELLFYDEPKKQKVTLKLPSGTMLTIDDDLQAVSMQDKAGENAFKIDLKGGVMQLQAKTKIVFTAGETSVTLESSGDITQKAKNKISMQAATIEGEGSTQVTMQGGAVEAKAESTLDLQSSGATTIKGKVVNLN